MGDTALSNRKIMNEFKVVTPLRYAVTVIGALALNAALWSGVYSQISNPGAQIFGAATAGHVVTMGPGVGQIQDGGAAPAAPYTPAALTGANDTNVTLTLSGTPNTALLQAVTATMGWTGTLAAARLNGNVVQSFTSTDISGSVTAQAASLQLGAFTGDVTKTAGSLATIVAKFSGNVLPTGAGADSQILLGSGASNFIFSTIPNCPAGAIQYTAATHLFNCAAGGGSVTSVGVSNSYGLTLGGTNPVTGAGTISTAVALTNISNFLSANAAIANGSFNGLGPSVAQGATGTWLATGTITFTNTAAGGNLQCKLTDGTTVIASGSDNQITLNGFGTISLSGALASPAGNIRIDCMANDATHGYVFNASGQSKDTGLTAVRIQ